MSCARRSGHRRSKGAADFPIALFLLIFFALFPILDLSMLAVCYGMLYVVNHQEAVRASAQQNYSDALTVMTEESGIFQGSGFAAMAQLSPSGGYSNCGSHLYVDATNYINKNVQSFGPDKPLPPPVDPTAFIYEYRVESTYVMQPLINLSSVPFLSQVPGLGASAKIHWSSHCLCEHPDGLIGSNGNAGTSFKGGQGTVDLSVSGLEDTPGVLSDLSNSNWQNPNIYQQIHNAGETVVAEDVVIVNANNWLFTPVDPHITVNPSEKLWVDYWCNGSWSVQNQPGSSDANGYAGTHVGIGDTANLPVGAMVGKIGTGNPVFYVGNHTDIQLQNTGPLSLCINWAPFLNGNLNITNGQQFFANNKGQMMVRVIITR